MRSDSVSVCDALLRARRVLVGDKSRRIGSWDMLWRRNLEGEVEGERERDRTGEMEGERLGGVWAPGLCNRGGLIVGFGSAMVTRPSAVGSVIECGARLR